VSGHTPRGLLTATEAAAFYGYDVSTFYKMVKSGDIPGCAEIRATYGQKHSRRWSALLLELHAANVDIEHLDEATLARLVIEERTRVQLAVTAPAALAPADEQQKRAS
jgi:hypothetical protein